MLCVSVITLSRFCASPCIVWSCLISSACASNWRSRSLSVSLCVWRSDLTRVRVCIFWVIWINVYCVRIIIPMVLSIKIFQIPVHYLTRPFAFVLGWLGFGSIESKAARVDPWPRRVRLPIRHCVLLTAPGQHVLWYGVKRWSHGPWVLASNGPW